MPTADLGDIKLHYREHGEGPPALGIMGFSLDQRFWASQIPAVTATHRFIVFDNRGVGGSRGPIIGTIDEMANDALRLLDHLEIEQTVVFGVSMGGAIGQRLVLDHPERVSGLVLAVTWARPIEFMRRQQVMARKLISLGDENDLIEMSLLRMFTPRFFEIGQESVDRMIAAFFAETGPGAPGADVLLAQLSALDKHDTLSELPNVSCPTLVIGGKMDMMVPGFASEEIAAAIPGAELALFETGHGLMVEEMQAVNERIADFLRRLR